METEGAGEGKSDPSIKQIKLGVLLGILGQAAQPMDDGEMHLKRVQKTSTSSRRGCFRSPSQRRNQ